MEITRNAFGTETKIALTNEELEQAAKEYIFRTARAEVIKQLLDSEEKYENVPGDLIDVIATEFIERMDGVLRDETVLAVIHQHDEELEQYKQKWKVFTARVVQTKDRYFTIRAKDKDEANDLLEGFLNDCWDKAEDYFEDEDGEYEFYSIEEDDYVDPDDAEVKGDDD